jgi:hypothetical protein
VDHGRPVLGGAIPEDHDRAERETVRRAEEPLYFERSMSAGPGRAMNDVTGPVAA